MWQGFRLVLTAIAGFSGLLISAFVIEGDRQLILTHHLDQTVAHAFLHVFGRWGGNAVYLFLFVGTPGLLLATVLFGEGQRWREVVTSASKVIRMDEWLQRNRDPS